MIPSSSPYTDIRPNHPVFRLTPAWVWPYVSLMRLDRPIGTWLLLLPGWWAIIMTAQGVGNMTLTHYYLLCLFAVGAVVMRGAGCVINDIWDRNIDRQVERTQNRPMASGRVSVTQALLFTSFLMLVGLAILLQLSPLAIGLGVLSLVPVILYPLAKRVTWYPQAVLGLTFNFGVLIGAAAILGTVPATAIVLYIGGFFWTLGYDTIYAHQDIADDGIVGVKSTARKFGAKSPAYVAIFYSIFAGLTFLTGYLNQMQPLFYIFWALASCHLLWQVTRWTPDNQHDCLQKFRSNREYGLLLCAAYFFGYIS